MRNWLLGVASLIFITTPAYSAWVWVPTGQEEVVLSTTPSQAPIEEPVEELIVVPEEPVTPLIIDDAPILEDTVLPTNNDALVPYEQITIAKDQPDLYIEENQIIETDYVVYEDDFNEILTYLHLSETFYVEENFDNFEELVKDDVLFQHERNYR